MSAKPSAIGLLIEQRGELSALGQAQKDTNDRLFGGNGHIGAIQYLADIDTKQGKALTELTNLVQAYKVDTDKQFAAIAATKKTERAYVVGFAAAAGGLGSGLVKIFGPLYTFFKHHP